MTMIRQTNLFPAAPSTTRGALTVISYDSSNDRIAYVAGKSVIVCSLDYQRSPIQFTKHIVNATVASFSPSGNYVASGDESGNIKIWDSSIYGREVSFEQPLVKSEFQVFSGPIKSIAWDAENLRIIAVGRGKEKFAHCFSWDSGNSIGEIQGHSETINAVDIKPVRPYRAATVGDDKALVFFNGPPFKFNKSNRGYHSNSVRSVKFSPDGKWLVSVGSDRAIVLYDGNTGEAVKKLEDAHDGGIFGVSWSADLASFVTSSADNSLKRWNTEEFKEIGTFKLPRPNSVDSQQVSVVVTKNYVLSVSLNGVFNLFDHDGAFSHSIYGHQRALTELTFENLSSLITGASDGSLCAWTVKEGGLEPICSEFENSHSNYITGIRLFNGGLVTSGWDDKLKYWKNRKVENTVDLSGQPKAILVVSEKLVVLYEDNLEVYDSTLSKIASLELNFMASAADAVSGEESLLLTNKTAMRIEEYKISTSIEHLRSYPELHAAPTLVKVSPNGKYAAVVDSTGKYTLYNTKDCTIVTTRWAFHTSRVNGAAWTSDSKYLVSGGLDCAIFVYSVARPSMVLKALLTHQTGVSGFCWLTYDGVRGSFASVGLDGMVKTWDVNFSTY